MTALRSTLSLLAALTVAASAGAATSPGVDDSTADAITVFNCVFDEPWDVNYDDWPDGWTRHEDAEHPHYVQMKLVNDYDAPAGRALELHLDGARARLFSPPMRVAARFSYTVIVKLKTERLVHSKVELAIDFLDHRGRMLQSVSHEPIIEVDGWTTFKIQAVRPVSPRTDRAVVRIETHRGDRGDLKGVVSIGSITVARLPSMDVTTNSPFNVYTDPSEVVVTCSLSGIGEQDPWIRFQLLDATSDALDAEVGMEQLNGAPIGANAKVIHQESLQASEIIHGSNSHRAGFEGSTHWRPPLAVFGYGFYHIKVDMVGKRSKQVEKSQTITIAIVPHRNEMPPGEFGWTLPTTDKPLPFDTLQELLPQAGVSWVKFPVWFEEGATKRGEEILRFVEQLAAKDIETIGILEEPENTPERDVGETAFSEIAGLLAEDPSHWQPLFDHLMTRLSLRIRYWQFGVDHDTSFVGYDDLVNRINAIRQKLYRFGQDVRVGLGWRWDIPPVGGKLSWDFEQMSVAPPPVATKLDELLTDPVQSSAKRWVLIEPTIDETRYETDRERLDARIRELIHQIVVAKWRGVEGIFIANPFSGEEGLMRADGTPGDLLLPWRTAALHLSGARYVGKLTLPRGSHNWVFQQGDLHLMVIWNDNPTEEVLYLGDDIRQVSVWGQTTRPKAIEGRDGIRRQVIPVGPAPMFLLGVNGQVAKWRMAVHLERERVPSVFADEHINAVFMRNPFPQGVGGTLRITVPQIDDTGTAAPLDLVNRPKSTEWRIGPEEGEFRAQPGGEVRHPFTIQLNNATYGPQPVRIDFEVNAEQTYRFSVWRNMQVGLGEVEIGVKSHLDENGRLVVKQRMINHTDKRLDFKCRLNAEGRRRKRNQVFQLGPEGDDKFYNYSRGEELIGKQLQLRLEEENGSRVIVHRFIAER